LAGVEKSLEDAEQVNRKRKALSEAQEVFAELHHDADHLPGKRQSFKDAWNALNSIKASPHFEGLASCALS
jgi:hypothetical protein